MVRQAMLLLFSYEGRPKEAISYICHSFTGLKDLQLEFRNGGENQVRPPPPLPDGTQPGQTWWPRTITVHSPDCCRANVAHDLELLPDAGAGVDAGLDGREGFLHHITRDLGEYNSLCAAQIGDRA